MGKDGFLTAKAIGNRIKAKGLQKLRWYCQACQKQCRDENGYKNHIDSEPHQRMMLVVSENAGAVSSAYSDEFHKEFIRILSRRYQTRLVKANQVYKEYIADRHHVHMNATRWNTLTEYCYWLGRQGIVKVEENEKGLFIQWIDTSPAALERQAAIAKQDRAKKTSDERDRAALAERMKSAESSEQAKQLVEQQEKAKATKLDKSRTEAISLGGFLPAASTVDVKTAENKKRTALFDDDDEEEEAKEDTSDAHRKKKPTFVPQSFRPFDDRHRQDRPQDRRVEDRR